MSSQIMVALRNYPVRGAKLEILPLFVNPISSLSSSLRQLCHLRGPLLHMVAFFLATVQLDFSSTIALLVYPPAYIAEILQPLISKLHLGVLIILPWQPTTSG